MVSVRSAGAHGRKNHDRWILSSSILVALGWLATCDGHLDDKELARFTAIAESSGITNPNDIKALLSLAEYQDLEALDAACRVIRERCSGPNARLFMEMAIGMAIADGVLVTTENHLLRFFADLVGFSCQQFNSLFRDATGRPLPQPTDLSSRAYWAGVDADDENRKRSRQRSDETRNRASRVPEITEAYAILGLERGASKDEIKRAYRRLAQIHHPDRFSSLGDASVAAATSTFQRIKAAYDLLVKYA